MSEVPPLDYQEHLFEERALTSVTANTREDGSALLALAARIPLRPRTHAFAFERANEALLALARGAFSGSAVLRICA